MSDTRWFQLRDHIGLTAKQNQEPLVSESFAILLPRMVDDELVSDTASITILPAPTLADGEHARIVPGTRTIECNDYRVADALSQRGYDEIDLPTKAALTKAAKALTDATQEAGTHEPDPEANPEQYAEGHAKNEKGE